MTLSKALFTAGMFLKDGNLHELGGKPMTEDDVRSIVIKQRMVMHDYYISPGTPKMMNEENRYLEAVETILGFMAMKPALDELGIDYETGLKEQ